MRLNFQQSGELKIENRILEFARRKSNFIREDISKTEALSYFEEKNDEYKTVSDD